MKTFKDYILEFYKEEKNSTFQNGKDVYQLNKIFELSEKIKPIKMAIDKLSWILKYIDVRKRVELANIKIPILVWKDKGQWIVVDGAHRLKKAISLGKDEILVKVLSNDLMKKSLIS